MQVIILSGTPRRVDTLPQCIASLSGFAYKVVSDIDYGSEPKTVYQKMTFAYKQCLTESGSQDVLILEDDAILCNDWQNKLNEYIKTTQDEKYIISLWDGITRGGRIGAVAIYYSNGTAKDFSSYIQNQSHQFVPHDAYLQLFLKQNNIKQYVYKLADHSGDNNSTWR